MERTHYCKISVMLVFTVHISRVHVYKEFIVFTSYEQLCTAIIIFFYFTYILLICCLSKRNLQNTRTLSYI